jgi:hypothetical protein
MQQRADKHPFRKFIRLGGNTMPSKLSFHVMGFDNHVFDYLQQMQPALVKIFEFPSDVNVDELRRRCPGALIVYRQYTNLSFNDPADAFVAEMGARSLNLVCSLCAIDACARRTRRRVLFLDRQPATRVGAAACPRRYGM